MPQPETLYRECPLCNQSEVAWDGAVSLYRCPTCGLSLKDASFMKLFHKGCYKIESFGSGHYRLAEQGLLNSSLTLDPLKVTIGNVYEDESLARIAAGELELLRPVRTVLAQIILEQLREECFIHVTNLRRGHGSPLADEADYLPAGPVPRQGMAWQDEGNLFGTTHRLVLPSDRFTFIRLDRKLTGVKAFTDGVAVQRKGEDFATYFVGCYPHEAALIAAYVMAKAPKLRKILNTVEE